MAYQVTILGVLILKRDDCECCDAATTMLERLSREYPLSLSTLEMESVAGQALAESGGILFPPGIFLDGEPCCYGRPFGVPAAKRNRAAPVSRF